MENSYDCPFCDGKALLKERPLVLKLRNNDYSVTQYYYECSTCKEEFTDNITDSATLDQVIQQVPDYGKE